MRLLYTTIALVVLTMLGTLPALPMVGRVSAADPTQYALLADFDGWNFTSPPVNPTIRSVFLFTGQSFTVRVVYADAFISHNLAYYLPGTLPQEVALPFEESPKRLAHSGDVSPRDSATALSFSFAQHGFYEYFCEYHPSTMHGQVRALRSPDINNDRTVNVLDLVSVGGIFLSTPSSPNWRPEADLNFDNIINILDLVIIAGNMFRML